MRGATGPGRAAATSPPAPPPSPLVPALAALAAGVAGGAAPAAAGRGHRPVPVPTGATAAAPATGDGDFTVLAERADATVVRVGGVVAKAHPAGTVAGELRIRVGVAASPAAAGVLLPPCGAAAEAGGRIVTFWPYGVPVDPGESGDTPWAAAGTLLARLHAVQPAALPGPLPPMRGPAKVARAMERLRGAPESAAARTVRRAWRRLPAWSRGEAPYEGRSFLCHGDWHLGQLVRDPGTYTSAPNGGPHNGPHTSVPQPAARSAPPGRGWLLIDIDDLGLGDPAWDLARPAMWFGAGLLAPEAWARFLGAYRAAGGTAVSPGGDPWARLDIPARALAVQSAAIAVAKAARDGRELDEAESELLATCARIAQLQ